MLEDNKTFMEGDARHIVSSLTTTVHSWLLAGWCRPEDYAVLELLLLRNRLYLNYIKLLS